ncbi:endonuclease VII domain-containing protein [Streptomyces clavifer]|uniref:endonuclease VII domain-containing protein n=1 Tax=Streptomyces clavifer TaxID=68188 RepID=UPI00308D5493|nr:endonuclease VII domain-containing protein [Streptomyces clavifer]
MSELGEEKWCSGCKRELPLPAFASDRNRRDGLQPRCRECVAAYGAAHYRRRREAQGKPVRQRADVPQGHKECRPCGEVKPHSEWHRNATAPDGLATRCKACKAIQGRAGHLKRQYCLSAPAVHVDHCHETGRVRGVLCFNCNSAIGKLGDDPDSLRRAIAYLEGNAWKPTLVAPGVYQLPS